MGAARRRRTIRSLDRPLSDGVGGDSSVWGEIGDRNFLSGRFEELMGRPDPSFHNGPDAVSATDCAPGETYCTLKIQALQ